MSPSAAAVIIFDQVQLRMERQRLPFAFTYSGITDTPITINAGDVTASATLMQMAAIECAGHAERFGADLAHGLVERIVEEAKKKKATKKGRKR